MCTGTKCKGICVALAHIYHYGIWHHVSRCTYPRCALLRNIIVGHFPCTGVDERVGARRHTEQRVDGYCPCTGMDDVVVCADTPKNASMVTAYAPAWTTVVVCAGTPHNKLRVTIHAPAWTKVVVCVGTPSATFCDVYRRRTRVSRRPLCCAPARSVCCDTHAS